jgi:hypothetical protein
MDTQEEIREVPFTVRRPVTERIVSKIPVQVCKWIETEEVRKVPVRTERIEYEERVEPYRVKVLKYQTENQVLREPRTTQKWVAYESVQRVPRAVYYRVPIDSQGNDLVPALPPPPTVTKKPATSNAAGRTPRPTAPAVPAAPTREVAPAAAEEPVEDSANEPAASDMGPDSVARQRPALDASGAAPASNPAAPRTLEPPAAAPPAATSPADASPSTSGSGPLDFVPKATGRLNAGPAAVQRGGMRIPLRPRNL